MKGAEFYGLEKHPGRQQTLRGVNSSFQLLKPYERTAKHDWRQSTLVKPQKSNVECVIEQSS